MLSRRWLELAIPLLSGAVYLLTATPHVVGGDSGEFATLLVTGGVAHPPGFPLYVMLLRAFRFVPAQSPAHAAALLSAVTATVTVYAVGRAARLYGASLPAAAVASAMFASAALTWKLATHAEVFSQAALFAALVVVVSAPGLPLRGARRAGLLGLVAGLSLSTHLALVFLAPVGVYAFVRALRDGASRGRTFLAGVLGLAVGLLPYAYILVAAKTADPLRAWVWGTPGSLSGLVDHFLRADYGTFKLDAGETKPDPFAHLSRFALAIVRDFLGLPLIALAGLVSWMRKNQLRVGLRDRAETTALAASFFTIGVCFIGMFNRPLVGIGPAIVERFYLLPMVPLTVLGALSISHLVPSILERVIGVVLPFLTLACGFALSADPVREASRPTLQYYVDNVLGFVPKETVLLGDGDHLVAGFLYGLRAQDRRRDVEFLSPRLLNAEWYRESASRRLGVSLSAPVGPRPLERWIEELIAAKKTVLLAGVLPPGLETHFPTYPEGSLVRVLPKGTLPPQPEQVEALNLEIYSRFRIEGVAPAPGTWNRLVQANYARTWLALSSAFSAKGREVEARRCRERAVELAPWLGSDSAR